MKIIFATPLYPPEIEDPATYVKELAKRMRGMHEIIIAAYASTAEEIPGVTVVTVSKRSPLPARLLRYLLLLFRVAHGADVIYAQNALAAGLPAVIVGRLRGIPVVLHFAEDEAWKNATRLRLTNKSVEAFLRAHGHNVKTRLRMFLQGFVLRRANLVTAPSAHLARAAVYVYRVPQERVVMNHYAAEQPQIIPFPAHPVPRQIIAFARLVKWSNVAGVIRTTAILAKEFSDVRLLVAGDGSEKETLQALAENLGIGRTVVFLGRVSRAESWHVRKTSAVYVLNHTEEITARDIQSGLAAGVPVVTANILGVNEIIRDGESGLLVAPESDEELTAAIARLFSDQDLRARLVRGGERVLAEKLSWDAHILTLCNLFDGVCGKPRR